MVETGKKPPPGSDPDDGLLVFSVNGVKFEVPKVDPSTTLLDFLRNQTPYKGPKLGCGEGGCGACVVVLSKYNPVLDEIEEFNVSSCLTLLCSINDCSVTTTEGLGNLEKGFHPIQQRFAGFNASQCGFCTPGMCMSFFSALTNAKKLKRPEPPPGFSKLTVSEAERAIAGNLCRCTGYRPIADACKSFAADVDLEDLGLNSFWKKGDPEENMIKNLPAYDPNLIVNPYPEYLKERAKLAVKLDPKNYSWYSPTTLEELGSLLNSDDCTRVKLLVANTGMGYYKDVEHFGKYIDLTHIPQLSIIKANKEGIEIGTAVSIARVITFLREDDCVNYSSSDKMVFRKLADHMEKIATGFIRNSASIGGNLVMSQSRGFPSDMATILLGAASTVSIITDGKQEILTLDEFLAREPMDPRSVLLNVQIPFLNPKGRGSKFKFETYRAAPRPLGSAIAYLNASFLADVCYNANGVTINDIRLAFGAFGTKHAIRATKVEEYLSGKLMTVTVLYEAVKLVKEEVIPEPGTSHADYRNSLAVTFLYQFLSPFVPGTSICPDNFSLLVSGSQDVQSSSEYSPVGEPIPKTAAVLQASGEAQYIDDIPSPPNCLHGAFVYSTKPYARVDGVDIKSETAVATITYKDIPAAGENVGSLTFDGFDPLFSDEFTRSAGEPIAFVVAETQKAADIAASTAEVKYDTKNLDPPILTVEEAVERSSFTPVTDAEIPPPVGDLEKGMAEADQVIQKAKVNLPSQYFFYMETQTALAIPDEDNCMVVYSSVQNPEYEQVVIARCLGVPANNIRIITRRCGGGFGGKASKAMPIAAACAVAAQKLRRPVRIYLNRNTDMIMTGGRHPVKITYDVGFKSNGKVTALSLEILIDAGITIDFSPLIPALLVSGLKKYNWGALSFDIKVCKTNQCGKTMMRGPGDVQGSYIAEAILENIASTLSLEVDSVRKTNLHTFPSLNTFYGQASGEAAEYTLPDIWDKLSSSLTKRMEAIEQFNQGSVWMKRGISRVPVVFQVTQRPIAGKVGILRDGSVVVEVGGIEIGQGLWTKVKQVTAYALSLIGCAGTENLLDKIRVVQADTVSLVQGGVTAGSTASESSSGAVRLCCNTLVERLRPVLTDLQKQTGTVDWDTLITQAYNQAVNLASHSLFSPDSSIAAYLNYGAAVSEVEINLLTGETTFLRADIIYDCGQSMNPAVDLGQIEGAFVQGIGFFMLEEYLVNNDGVMITNSTFNYKIPTLDTIPKQINVEVLNSGHHKNCVLSSKASGEPPLLLSASVHCAARAAIKAAREQLKGWGKLRATDSAFELEVPALMPVVKTLCGLNNVEAYLESLNKG